MALYSSIRDTNLIKGLNRELMGNIITQQCSFYKFKLKETKVNIYGEASGEKYYDGPILLNCLIDRETPAFSETDIGSDFNWNIEFRFLRDDLVDINLIPEVGDIILYNERYFEIDTLSQNQFFMGKNPDYANSLVTGLGNYGYNVAIICKTHTVPSDKVGITRERLI